MLTKMKKHIIDIAAFICMGITLGTSCKFLEVEQIGKSDIEGYYTEVEAAHAAVYGTMHLAYSLFDSYLFLYSEIAADEIVLSTRQSIWDMYQNFSNTQDDETGALGMIWKNGYQVINNCNQIIEHIPGLKEQFPDRSEELDVYLAQSLFLRALVHHNLCLCYGQNYSYTPDASHLGIFIADHTQSLSELPARASVGAVYKSIVSDLEKSLELYPKSYVFDKYFPSPLSSKALLARVCLHMGDWTYAVKYSSDVMKEKGLVSHDNYFNMFYTHDEIADDECIFRFDGFKQGAACYKIFWSKEADARPSERVLGLLEDSQDIRSTLLTDEKYGNSCKKYDCNIELSSDETYKNHPVLRVSEMYLINAEAALRLGNASQAVSDIEALRTRAYGKEMKLTDEEKADMDITIAEERIRELCFEGHRLWDISRRHENITRTSDHTSTVSSLSYPDHRFVLPIPSTELEANRNMQPNPGFSKDDNKEEDQEILEN